jgi:hypothetical protein
MPSAPAAERLSDRELNRALLARQGLLDRFDLPLVELVESIGAMQGQAWSALPVGLWSRARRFSTEDLYAALERRELLWGIGIRGTLHLVSSREHPFYAVVAAAASTRLWHRAINETTPAMDELRAALLEYAKEPRTSDELREFADAWVEEHPGAVDPREVEAQRALRWRPIYRWSALTRVPAGGRWGAKAPAGHLAAPVPPDSPDAPGLDEALAQVARFHLRAFGPAAAEDVATWVGLRTPQVRALLEQLASELAVFEDERGRTLYDLPGSLRPGPETPAPPRLLGAFDSTLLTYAAGHRGRIVPDALRDLVYQRANLQVRPTFLLDGLVAGTWSVEVARGEATLTLRPAGRLSRRDRSALETEAAALLESLYADAKSRRLAVEPA